MSQSVKGGSYYSFFTFISFTIIEILTNRDKNKRLIPQIWNQFDDLMPMATIIGLKNTGVTYESLTTLVPFSVLTSMAYDIMRNKNKFYFNPIYKNRKFGRNMYVFSLKKLTSNQLNKIVYVIEKTKLGNKLIGWIRKF